MLTNELLEAKYRAQRAWRGKAAMICTSTRRIYTGSCRMWSASMASSFAIAMPQENGVCARQCKRI